MVSAIDTERPSRGKEDIKSRVFSRVTSALENYLSFYYQMASRTTPGWPTFSQSMRIKALRDNKRILVADDTGVNGKTFTTIASKLNLDQEYKTRHPALIVAPNSGMLNAWSPEEVNRYAGYMKSPEQNVVTVRDYTDLAKVDKNTDFTVINWEKLSIREDDPRWNLIDETIKRVKPKFYAFDECHNAKGSSSLRGHTIRRLTEYTKDNYLMLLSATPIPNRYRDLGMIFYMLDPKKYPTPTMFSHCAPDIMQELLNRQVWFRLTRNDLKQELGLPDFKEYEIPVKLSDKEAEIYFKAWADCVCLGEGLTELRKALYDPRLSKYAPSGIESGSKLEAIAELVTRLENKGEKIIVKTNYVTDVVPTIATRLNHIRNVIVVTGGTLLHERKDAYLRFRNDPDYNVMITSPVTEESIDLTTGNRPCSMITFEPEMTPREFDQFSGRVYRRGQMAEVSHYSLITESQVLFELMIGHLKELQKEYGVKIPKKFRPRTIDSDMLAMRKAKQDIVNQVYGGVRITKQQESVYDANEVDRAITHLEGIIAPSTFKSMSPFQLSTITQARWRNLGEDNFAKLVKSKGWRKWKSLYEEGWKDSASHSTLKGIGKLLDDLEQDTGQRPLVVDMGSGAAYFSRATGREVTCVDIDPKFLQLGKKICDKKGINNQYVVGTATNSTLPNNHADAVINSYMLFYLAQDDSRSEIEKAVIETNRITREGGRFVISLPYSIDDSAVERFNGNLGAYGFTLKDFFDKKRTRNENMKNGCYISVFEKTAQCREPQGKDLSFYANRTRFIH